MITSASKLLIVAAAAASGAALAQPAREPVPIESERRLLGQLDELRTERGLNAEELIEPLRALALVYQEAGDHVQAVVALQGARQVVRASRGSSATVDEALLLRQQIRSEKALGNGERVWNLQHDLAAIARQTCAQGSMSLVRPARSPGRPTAAGAPRQSPSPARGLARSVPGVRSPSAFTRLFYGTTPTRSRSSERRLREPGASRSRETCPEPRAVRARIRSVLGRNVRRVSRVGARRQLHGSGASVSARTRNRAHPRAKAAPISARAERRPALLRLATSRDGAPP